MDYKICLLLMMTFWNWDLNQARQIPSSDGDPPTVNNVADKKVISIDPKLRKALLRVLSKLEEEEGEKESPIENRDVEQAEEKVLSFFGRKAQSEDLGSVEASKETPHYSPDNAQSPDYSFIAPPTIANDVEEVKEEEKYPSTSPRPQAIFIPYPTPLEAPDEETDAKNKENPNHNSSPSENLIAEEIEELEDEQEDNVEEEEEEEGRDTGSTKTIVETNPSISEVVDPSISEAVDPSASDVEDDKNKTISKPQKHVVEFLPSDLVAAFTVQQDDRGIPRKVIPLDYNKPKDKNSNEQDQETKQKEIAQRKAQLELELRLLRHQQEVQERELAKLRVSAGEEYPPLVSGDFYTHLSDSDRYLQEQARKKQQEILLGQQRQVEYERQRELERQREAYRQQEIQRQIEQQRRLELQHQQELQRQKYREEQIRQRQGIDLLKSVDYSFGRPSAHNHGFFNPNHYQTQFVPGIELNRVNRQEGANFIGNFGFHSIQPSPDRQLQNLFLQSGIGKSRAGEDLSIVTKVLALNHGTEFFSGGSTKRQQSPNNFVTLPSSEVQPPTL